MSTERFKLEFDADSTIGKNMVRLLSDQLATTSVVVVDYGAVVETQQAPQANRPCPECEGGSITVYSTKRRKDVAVRYSKCWGCGYKPDNYREVVPASEVPSRARKNTGL